MVARSDYSSVLDYADALNRSARNWQTQASEPIESRAEQYRSPGDNSSPAGEAVCAVIGASSFDGKIVWWGDFMVIDGKITASFAMVFADCLFTPRAGLAKLYADEQLIVSNVAPTRQSTQNIRFYDGTQTAVDPLLTTRLGAARATAWPGFVYAVFEDFDCSSYGNRAPLIRAVLSGAATDTPGNEEQSVLNLGPLAGYANGKFAVDAFRGLHYQIVAAGADDAFVLTIDIDTLEEINRVAIHGTTFGLIKHAVSLPGTDFLAIAIDEGGWHPALLDAQTGEIVAELPPVMGGVGLYELGPKRATLLRSNSATKLVVVTESEDFNGNTIAGSTIGAFIADVTAATLTWIIHPGSAPAVGSESGIPAGASGSSVEFGIVVDGVLPVWYTDGPGNGVVNLALVNETGFTSAAFYTESVSGKEPRGVAYDDARNVLVVYREDGSFLKLDGATGALISTHAGAITDFVINVWATQSGGALQYTSRPGYVIAARSGGGAYADDIWEIDLATLEATLVIDQSDYSDDDTSKFFTGRSGLQTEASGSAGIINRITLGGVTPDTVDLVDIFSQLATFDGRFDLADLDFSGFPGNEASGLKLENDTTIDNLEQSIAEIFDVRIVPSDGVRKYFYPARDGSFAVTATVDPEEFVEAGSQTIVKTFGAGEDEMAGCAVSYHDVDADYKKLEQSYARPVGIYDVTRSKKKRTFNTVLSLTAGQAMRLATTAVYRSVLGNENFSFSLVPGKSHVEPADILEFDFRGFTVYGRVKEATLAADLTQSVLAYQYLQYADATFTGAVLGIPQDVLQSVASRMIYLDVPLLSYAHDLGGTGLVQYLQLAGFGPGIINASAYKSVNGETFALLGSLSNVAPVVGTVTAISGFPADPFVMDETGTITVAIGGGDIDELHTITGPEFDAGLNLAAVGRNGRWVMIWFQTVSSSNGSAVLSDLMWGVRGSEPWIGQLVAGDTFVLIDVARYTRFRNETADLDRTFFYKAATAGVPLGYVPTLAYPASGVAETPYAPTSLDASFDGSDIDLSWDYRSRLTTGFNPANHGEASLAFEVDIMDGATVTRTLTSSTNSVTYTAAQITEDFGSMPEALTFRVYMMSALVGRGYRAEATVGEVFMVADFENGQYAANGMPVSFEDFFITDDDFFGLEDAVVPGVGLSFAAGTDTGLATTGDMLAAILAGATVVWELEVIPTPSVAVDYSIEMDIYPDDLVKAAKASARLRNYDYDDTWPAMPLVVGSNRIAWTRTAAGVMSISVNGASAGTIPAAVPGSGDPAVSAGLTLYVQGWSFTGGHIVTPTNLVLRNMTALRPVSDAALPALSSRIIRNAGAVYTITGTAAAVIAGGGSELREDGGLELREDGSEELREL